MENKAAENVQQEVPIIALDSGENKVTSVENLPLPGLNSSESSPVATMDDVWVDIVATIAENSDSPVVVVTAKNEEILEKVGATVELVEPEVMAPLPNEQATSGDGQRDEPRDESAFEQPCEQAQVPPQAPLLEQQLMQQQQVPPQAPLLEQQLMQQQQVPPQAPMLDQQLEQQQQQQVPLQYPMLDQQIEQQQLQVQPQEPMEANGNVVFKKRKRGCRGGRKKKPSSNRQLTVDDVELSFDVPPRDDEEAGPPNRRQAVGENVPVYVPPGAASGTDSIASAGALASPKQQLPVRLTGVMFDGLRPIPTDPTVDPAPRHCFNCWKPGHFRQVCPSAKEHSYCYNCGRDGVDMADCPRCSGAHAEWLERTYSAERSQATEEHRRAYESWREATPDRVVSEPRRVDFDLRIPTRNNGIDERSWDMIDKHIQETWPGNIILLTLCSGEITTPEVESRPRIIQECHDSAIAGHKGMKKTYNRVRKKYFSKGIKDKTRVKTRLPLMITTMPTTAFELIEMDIEMSPMYRRFASQNLSETQITRPRNPILTSSVEMARAQEVICMGQPAEPDNNEGGEIRILPKHADVLQRLSQVQRPLAIFQRSAPLEWQVANIRLLRMRLLRFPPPRLLEGERAPGRVNDLAPAARSEYLQVIRGSHSRNPLLRQCFHAVLNALIVPLGAWRGTCCYEEVKDVPGLLEVYKTGLEEPLFRTCRACPGPRCNRPVWVSRPVDRCNLFERVIILNFSMIEEGHVLETSPPTTNKDPLKKRKKSVCHSQLSCLYV
ncbi:unnamed protein product [Trichogramma brassicae]|uniref:CCHC-type domain-containing protein n=1 Tax=Trichogramma brassicae TaxID=86971 RepID=A0A6H5ITI6_9HYME|nr:unnamed protein product [Trichogramma brassicae]